MKPTLSKTARSLRNTAIALLFGIAATPGAHAADYDLGTLSLGANSFQYTFTDLAALYDSFLFTLPDPPPLYNLTLTVTGGNDVSLGHLTNWSGDRGIFNSGPPNILQSWTSIGDARWNDSLPASTYQAGVYSSALGTYTLTINVAAVPEAQTWALMALGLGLVAFRLRYRRRQTFA
jgi:hypothetical protein